MAEKTPQGAWWGVTDNRTGSFEELVRGEAKARLILARSVIAVDMAIAEGKAGVWEQAEAELALQAYGKALAALLRGDAEEPPSVEVALEAREEGGE